MEEKRYPHIDEEQGIDMACEPAVETVAVSPSANGVTVVDDWIDDLDWSKLPSLGPFSDEEAIARIDKFEERMAKGEVKWYSSDEVDKMLYEKYPWLR